MQTGSRDCPDMQVTYLVECSLNSEKKIRKKRSDEKWSWCEDYDKRTPGLDELLNQPLEMPIQLPLAHYWTPFIKFVNLPNFRKTIYF